MVIIVKCTETKFLSLNDFDTFTAWFEQDIYLSADMEIRKKHALCFDYYDFEGISLPHRLFPQVDQYYRIKFEMDPKIKLLEITKWLKMPE
jgi:hypothetical protein